LVASTKIAELSGKAAYWGNTRSAENTDRLATIAGHTSRKAFRELPPEDQTIAEAERLGKKQGSLIMKTYQKSRGAMNKFLKQGNHDLLRVPFDDMPFAKREELIQIFRKLIDDEEVALKTARDVFKHAAFQERRRHQQQLRDSSEEESEDLGGVAINNNDNELFEDSEGNLDGAEGDGEENRDAEGDFEDNGNAQENNDGEGDAEESDDAGGEDSDSLDENDKENEKGLPKNRVVAVGTLKRKKAQAAPVKRHKKKSRHH